MLAKNKLGKVYKYEFLNVSKILLPVYAAILVLGLFSGISNTSSKMNFNFQYNGQNLQFNQAPFYNNVITGAFSGVTIFYIFVLTLVSLIIFSRRFKKGMLEEEAYLNMTLPVTISQHIWGRLLAYMTWLILGFVCVICASLLSVIRILNFQSLKESFSSLHDYLHNSNIPVPVFYLEVAGIVLVLCLLFILFIFCINSISHLFKNHRTLAKVISAVVLVVITSKLWNLMGQIEVLKTFTNGACYFILVNLVACAVYLAITQFVFTKELNIE